MKFFLSANELGNSSRSAQQRLGKFSGEKGKRPFQLLEYQMEAVSDKLTPSRRRRLVIAVVTAMEKQLQNFHLAQMNT